MAAATQAEAALAAGTALVALGGSAAIWSRRSGPPLAAQALGMGILGVLGVVVAAEGSTAGSGFHSTLRPALGIDRLSAIFVAVLALVAVPALVYAAGYLAADIWSEPAHWCGAAAFALVLLVETGRQPIDNPDTHLELTMVHEGPLLEYAGRDLALLQWTMAARHWIFFVLGAALYLPHWGGFGVQVGLLVAGFAFLAAALAIIETGQAKLRLLRVPALLATGSTLALVGIASWVLS